MLLIGGIRSCGNSFVLSAHKIVQGAATEGRSLRGRPRPRKPVVFPFDRDRSTHSPYGFDVKLIRGLNDLLQRVAGVRMVRAQRINSLRTRADRAQTELRERDAEVERLRVRLESGAERRKGATRLPRDYEPEFRELWELVRERTMTSHYKAFGLYQAVHYVVRHDLPGAVVECGVWRGGSMLAVAHQLSRLDAPIRDLYLFDTYEGMTAPTDRDVQIRTRKSAEEVLATADQDSLVRAVASLEDVREAFDHVAYPADRVHFVKGPVEDTVPDLAPERIAILRLDTDWYESTKHELAHLYQRLVPGGVLILDDYGHWQGAKDAVDEFLDETGEPLLLLRAGTGRIAIKPGLSTRVQEGRDGHLPESG